MPDVSHIVRHALTPKTIINGTPNVTRRESKSDGNSNNETSSTVVNEEG